MIHSVCNIERNLGEMERVFTESQDRVLLRQDKPWESKYFGFYGSVLYQNGLWKMWYLAYSQGFGYAESSDGI